MMKSYIVTAFLIRLIFLTYISNLLNGHLLSNLLPDDEAWVGFDFIPRRAAAAKLLFHGHVELDCLADLERNSDPPVVVFVKKKATVVNRLDKPDLGGVSVNHVGRERG